VTTTASAVTTTKAPVTARQTLTLAPEQGGPGTAVAVMTTGLCLDSPQKMSLQWDNRSLHITNGPTPGTASVTAQFAVPDDASTGPHTVKALCGNAYATATFTVVQT
jgi:hypothetical protein